MSTIRIALNEPVAPRVASPARRRTDSEPLPGRTLAPAVPLPGEFSELYHEYFPKVFAYVYGRVQDREISLDIVADVFEKAFIKKKSLRSPDSFGSWLFTIARRRQIDVARRQSRRPEELHDDPAWNRVDESSTTAFDSASATAST